MTIITHEGTGTVHAVSGDVSEDDKDEGDNYYLSVECGIYVTGPIKRGHFNQRPPKKHCRSCWRVR